MKVAFFTEGGYQGKVPRNNANMRTDMAWVCAFRSRSLSFIFNKNKK